MTDQDRRHAIEYRADFAEDDRIRYWADQAGITREEWLLHQLARAIRNWAPSPPDRRRETQTEKRARYRATSPDGMAPHTREIQTITTDRSTTP